MLASALFLTVNGAGALSADRVLTRRRAESLARRPAVAAA